MNTLLILLLLQAFGFFGPKVKGTVETVTEGRNSNKDDYQEWTITSKDKMGSPHVRYYGPRLAQIRAGIALEFQEVLTPSPPPIEIFKSNTRQGMIRIRITIDGKETFRCAWVTEWIPLK